MMRNVHTIIIIIILCIICGISASAQQVTFTPICAGIDDTAALQAIITGAAGNPRTVKIPYKSDPAKRCAWSTITVPANITLDNTDGSGINRLVGQTITIAGAIVNPVGKTIFFGVGSVAFTGVLNGANGQVLQTDGQGGTGWTAQTGGGGAGVPGGSSGQLQYNCAGAFCGISGNTTDGSIVTLSNPVLLAGVTIGTGTAKPVESTVHVNSSNANGTNVSIRPVATTVSATVEMQADDYAGGNLQSVFLRYSGSAVAGNVSGSIRTRKGRDSFP